VLLALSGAVRRTDGLCVDEPVDFTDDLWRILGSISDWVRFADAKAGATLAVDGVMMVLLAGRLTRTPSPTAVAVIVLSIALTLAALSALAAVWTVMPRMRTLGADAMIHYGRIASFDTAESFAAGLKEPLSDPDRMAGVLASQIWTLSRAAAHKYRLVGLAVRLLAGALATGLTGLVLG
jgi:hypothetical protein